MQVFEQDGTRQAMIGISPEFALSRMDEIFHPECEVYVEDNAAKILLTEIISQKNPDLASRLLITTFGAASVGYQLGIMVDGKRFPRAVGVFLDGDCTPGSGCYVLPGGDAPERVVFESLAELNWGDLWSRLVRNNAAVADACNQSLTIGDHHEWVSEAAKKLMVGPDIFWHTMCAEWVQKCLDESDYNKIVDYIEDRLVEYS